MTLRSINPYTGVQIAEFSEFPAAFVGDLLEKSEKAFENWKRTEFSTRCVLMKKAAELLLDNAPLYAGTITAEMGKPVAESKAEIRKCAWACEFYAENAEKFLLPDAVATDADKSWISYEPLGPVLGIMPWNFPFWQVFRFAVPAIMAGNTVLLKHASNVQMCAASIESLMRSAGFPEGVFINLVIGSPRVKKVIENDVVKAVSITGSELAGQKVAGTAGSKIKKSVLELGGSNAFIVLEDADLERAVETGIKARMQNGGQSCIAAKRFIVHADISDRFITMFRERMKCLLAGDPMSERTVIGPLASKKQAEVVNEQVRKSVEMGAVLVEGGSPSGAFFPPTLLTNVRPGMPVFDEEVFGPVAPVIIAKDENEAVKLANSTRFGLGVTLFTGDLKKARHLIREFKDGAVFVNEQVKSDPRLPFGGTGNSGYGRELSFHGIREFVNVKTVYICK